MRGRRGREGKGRERTDNVVNGSRVFEIFGAVIHADILARGCSISFLSYCELIEFESHAITAGKSPGRWQLELGSGLIPQLYCNRIL